MISEFQTVYFVIKALDECAELEELLKALWDIQDDEHAGLHIIASSCVFPEVERFLLDVDFGSICVNESAINADISVFIGQSLERDRRLSKWPPKVREMVRRK